MNDDGMLVSRVRGINVSLMSRVTTELTGAPTGPNVNFPFSNDAFENDPHLVSKIGKALTNGRHVEFQNLPQGELSIDYQFLHMIVTHNFLPVGR